MLNSLDETVKFIQGQSSIRPKIGIILGSGLGSFAKEIKVDKSIPYSKIPHFKVPKVEGHSGQLILGWINETPIVCLQGRIHFYEGHTIHEVVYPMRTIAKLGIKTVFLTNAAGGLDPKMNAGDFMIIQDHINLMGTNPLVGPNESELGPRFPDMTEAYSLPLRQKLENVFKQLQLPYHKGVYCGLSGPTYETPAEVRYLQLVGGHAVGMSTVPETIVANHMGLQVCGVSCITNKAAGISPVKLSHTEVTETALKVEAVFTRLVREFILSLSA